MSVSRPWHRHGHGQANDSCDRLRSTAIDTSKDGETTKRRYGQVVLARLQGAGANRVNETIIRARGPRCPARVLGNGLRG